MTMSIVRLLVAALGVAAGVRAQDMAQSGDAARENGRITIVITGSVERDTPGEDTTIPPDLRIAVECHGESFDGRGTNQTGQFRFTITPESLTVAANTLCSAEAVLFGWNSSILRFPIHTGISMVNIGAITIRRSASGDAQDQNQERTGRTVSATSLKGAP